MAAVDRNVLRLGAFELLYLEDIPAKVSINEAIDLAKKYSGEEAGKFCKRHIRQYQERLRQGLMKYADLHIHTNFSDGTFSPARIVALAKKEGLNCISIADHDSLEAHKTSPTG